MAHPPEDRFNIHEAFETACTIIGQNVVFDELRARRDRQSNPVDDLIKEMAQTDDPKVDQHP